MPRSVPESDWKTLREHQPIALERFCQRVLAEAHSLSARTEPDAHQRYLKLYHLLRDRDRELARAFNDARRSTAIARLLNIQALHLLTPEEFARFSPQTRETIELLLNA